MKAIGYVRVSTTDQNTSLAVQEERIQAYCALAGLELTGVVRDEGVSGAVALSERPGGGQLLEALAGKQAGHVVALKLDRLFRDAADALNQTRTWEKDAIALPLIDLGGQSLNTASAVGRMFLTMISAFAEFERNLISERTSAALRHKQRTGRYIGAVPFGFEIVEHALRSVPHEMVVVEEARRLRGAGKTLLEIAGWLTERGIPTKRGGRWSQEHVRNLLSKPVYQERAS